jgi:hypothetical protein
VHDDAIEEALLHQRLRQHLVLRGGPGHGGDVPVPLRAVPVQRNRGLPIDRARQEML